MSFKSTVTIATENTQLQRSANIISDKIFLGQHTFTLEETSDGKTVLTNGELFAGILVKPFDRMFADNHRANGYDIFNRSLKARVETLAPQSNTLPAAFAHHR